jgi:hypothetical protein
MSNVIRACAGIVITTVSMSTIASAQTLSEPDHYTRWLLTIPADTQVRVNTKFGVYQLPIGYLNRRQFFHQNPTAVHNNVARYDAHQEQRWGSFAFNYWVPDGAMVWHRQPQVRVNRPIEPGHMLRSRESFVVNMHSMNPLDARITRKPDMSTLPEKLDTVLPAQPKFPKSAAYQGATRDGNRDDYLRFYIECRNDLLCEGWFVIDRRQMVLWVFVPRDAADLMLDAVKTAARLLDTWAERAAPANTEAWPQGGR